MLCSCFPTWRTRREARLLPGTPPKAVRDHSHLKTSCWQAPGVTSDAFHSSPIGGPALPFGKQHLPSGTCWHWRSAFPAKCTEEGGRSLYCQVLSGRQLSYSSFLMVFLCFSLLLPRHLVSSLYVKVWKWLGKVILILV